MEFRRREAAGLAWSAQQPRGHVTIPMRVCGPALRNFAYLVVDHASARAAIVDPAWELEVILHEMEKWGVTLSAVLLTHSHFDHVNCVTPLVERHPADVYMSAREIDSYGFRCHRLNAIEDGDVVRVGGTEVSCLLTPGHTAGGACYLMTDAIFTGDTVFGEGCGVCTSPGGNPVEMFDSVQRIKAQVDRRVQVFPGHSFGVEPGRALQSLMKENLYLQIEDRDEFVAWRMRSGAGEYLTR